jgi:suppressor of G2 allele of SKP1
VEVVLQKAAPGIKWGTWGSEEIGSVTSAHAGDKPPATPLAETTGNKTSAPKSPVPAPAAAAPPSTTTGATVTGAPAYPTSSRSGPKNWDKLDVAEGDDDTQDVNYFFKQLYKGATPEQQRAMMKSFIESNGTALSTDWDDVKSRKVETVPPEGVEAKKWDA